MSNPLDDSLARAVAVVGLAGVALIHVLDAHDTFVEAPYKGWLYVGLIAGTLITAAVLLRRDDARAWVAAALFPAGAFAAFVVSRTVGLPQGADDIGNWWEPLGLASLFVEAAVVAVAAPLAWTGLRLGSALQNPLKRVMADAVIDSPG